MFTGGFERSICVLERYKTAQALVHAASVFLFFMIYY